MKGIETISNKLIAAIKEAVKEAVVEAAELQTNLDNCNNELLIPSQSESEEEMARARVHIGFLENGEKVYAWVSGKTQDDLNDAVVKKYIATGRIWEFMDMPRGAAPEPQKSKGISFGEYAEQWMAIKKEQIRPTTLKDYTTILRSHLLPAFKDKEFASITPSDFQAFLNERSEFSKKYLTNIKKFFGMVCKDAIEDKILESNPAESRKIYIPSEKVTVREALPIEEFQDIASHVDELDHQDKLLLVLLMYTGMRLGEVLGLRWEDIDFENKLIHVRRSVTHPTNQPFIGATKTSNGLRTIPLLKELEDHLHPIPAEKDRYIIGGEKPFSKMQHRRTWERINRQIDLHGATAHVFRHTFLTILASTGIDVKTIQAIAGHGDIQITMNRYVHPVNENIQKAGALMMENLVVCAEKCA